jgi:uncharacterized protein (TIGR04552 family)
LESSLTVDASLSPLLRDPATMPHVDGGVSLQDMEAVHLILNGNSVVDWHRLDLDTLEKVDRHLALHLLDLRDPLDAERLRFLFDEAVHYLEENLDISFPPDLRKPDDVRNIFLMASQYEGFRRRQMFSCILLKLMHVLNHLEATDLRFRSSVSEARLIELAERRMLAFSEQMRAEGFPIVSFYGSRKTRSSIITKLITKRESTAATVFDKLRFRIVTETREDLLPAIIWLSRNVFPFNYVIPGQSHNNIATLRDMVRGRPALERLYGGLQGHGQGRDALAQEPNPFSGCDYRMINFIVDFPVRIDRYVARQDPRTRVILGRTVFVLVELQIVDRETAASNEEGENAHVLYKARQRKNVEARLKKGWINGVRAR